MKKLFLVFIFLFLLGAGCTTKVENKTQADTKSIVLDTFPAQSTGDENTSNPSALEPADTNQSNDEIMFNQATIKTNLGNIVVEFYVDDAPQTVKNFQDLVQAGFYDGIKFHRVMKDFMIQAGDPFSKDDTKKNMWGTGGPGYKFDDEINDHKLVKGSLAMANSGPNTNGSQFFIVTAPATPWLDGLHTNFGMVIEGMEVADKISKVDHDNTRPKEPVIIESIELSNK